MNKTLLLKRWLFGTLMCTGISATALAELPTLTTDTANPHWYLIKNVRTDRSDASRAGVTYAYAENEISQLKLALTSENEPDGNSYQKGSIWYFVSAGATDEDGYMPVRIYNALTCKYIKSVSGEWTTSANDGIWYLKSNTQNTYEGFNILSAKDVTNNSYGWNNASNGATLIGTYKGNDVGSIWDFEEPDNAKLQTTLSSSTHVTINWKKNNTTVAVSNKEMSIGETITCPASIGTGSATVTAGMTVDFILNQSVQPFRFVSARYTNRWAKTAANGITTEVRSDDGSDAEVFFEIPTSNSKSKLYSAKTMSYFAPAANSANPTATTENLSDAGEYTITKVDQGAETLFSDGIGFNIRDNHVAGWNGNDIGSRWFMVYDLEAYNANIEAYSATDNNCRYYQVYTSAKALRTEASSDPEVLASTEYAEFTTAIEAVEAARFGSQKNPSIPELLTTLETKRSNVDNLMGSARFATIKAKGDEFIALTNPGQEIVNAWTTASTLEGDVTPEKTEALKAAFDTMVAAASLTLDGVSVRIKGNRDTASNNYMIPTNTQDKICAVAGIYTDKQVFTLKHAAENGFYLYNEYTNKYAQSPANASAQTNLVTNVSDATVYHFIVGNYLKGLYAFAAYNRSETTECLHEAAGHNVVNWESPAEASWWSLTLASDADAASEHYAGAKAYYEGLSKTEEVGTYFVSEEDQTLAATTIASADAEGASTEEIYTAGTTLFNIHGSLAMPKPGNFYRFRGINDTPKYLSSVRNGNKMNMVEDADCNKLETVYYYNGSHLVALADGLVVSDYNKDDQSLWHNCQVTNTADAGVITFGEAAVAGRYTIEVDPSSVQRHIYNLNSTVDCGTNPNGNGYYWEIVPVTWLPIAGSNNTYTTVYSPVSLRLKENMAIYTASTENGKVKLAKVEGATHIPANTPVVLFTANEITDRANGLVYLHIEESDQTISATNSLQGSIYAKTAGENDLVFNQGKFVATEEVPGFAAYVEAAQTLNMSHSVGEQLLTSGKVYTIKESSNRGYLVYNDQQEAVWTSGKGSYDTNADENSLTEAKYHWTIVTDGSKHYLYNLGAQKFAGAYIPKNGSSAAAIEFAWHFSDYPTAVNIQPYDWAPGESVDATTFNILGGQNSLKEDRPAGMMVINGDNTPVVGISGVSSQDGCGFIFTEVPSYTETPATPAIETAKAEMETAYTHAQAADIDNCQDVIGYYATDALSQFIAAFEAVAEDADAEAKYYAVARAHKAVTDKQYNTFAHMNAYQLQLAGGQYVNATATGWELGELMDTEESNVSNWRAEIAEDGALTFTHKLNVEIENQPASARRRAEARASRQVTASIAATPAYDGLGNVSLNVEGLGKVRVTSLGSDENGDRTTAIREIEAAAESSDAIYDLQGRRVNRATRGLYIINGRKVML